MVWILTLEYDYEPTVILKVCANEDRAKQEQSKLSKRERDNSEITEYEVLP